MAFQANEERIICLIKDVKTLDIWRRLSENFIERREFRFSTYPMKTHTHTHTHKIPNELDLNMKKAKPSISEKNTEN